MTDNWMEKLRENKKHERDEDELDKRVMLERRRQFEAYIDEFWENLKATLETEVGRYKAAEKVSISTQLRGDEFTIEKAKRHPTGKLVVTLNRGREQIECDYTFQRTARPSDATTKHVAYFIQVEEGGLRLQGQDSLFVHQPVQDILTPFLENI